MGILNEMVDRHVMQNMHEIWKAQADAGCRWEFLLVSEGALSKVPEDGTYEFKIRQTPYVEKGKIIFCNSENEYHER